MKKCAICNKEINGGFLVERECLEKLQTKIDKVRALVTVRESQRQQIDALKAENAELKARIKELEQNDIRLVHQLIDDLARALVPEED